MQKLEQAYEAVKLLEELGLPIGQEQLAALNRLETDYLNETVIPKLREDLEALLSPLHNPFQFEVAFTPGGELQVRTLRAENNMVGEEEPNAPRRQKKHIIRVTFPDGTVSCHRTVMNTLVDTVRYAGCDKVADLRIPMRGTYLLARELSSNDLTASYQREIAPGYFLMVNSNTIDKAEQIRIISAKLGLHLKVEMVNLNTGEIE